MKKINCNVLIILTIVVFLTEVALITWTDLIWYEEKFYLFISIFYYLATYFYLLLRSDNSSGFKITISLLVFMILNLIHGDLLHKLMSSFAIFELAFLFMVLLYLKAHVVTNK